jgi:uncharacterized protein (DUF2126 family)/transglutaminase-like putative cysteine protease
MGIRVAVNHSTAYSYNRPISVSPQIIRLRPASHCRTLIHSYSLKIEPEDHFENWQQDPYGNFLLRAVFPEKVSQLRVQVDLVAEMAVINPFDFFVDEYAGKFPFQYEPWLKRDLRPYLETGPTGPKLQALVESVSGKRCKTVDFLVELNSHLRSEIGYLIRMEPGVQTCEETLSLRSGSCRDSAWLLVQLLRHLGLAARFVSGYLVQLAPDVKSLDGPSGTEHDFTDLHAWTEAYIPGAGWIGLDPTSGLLAGEGHIPLACTPDPSTAAPVTGQTEPCDAKFHFSMNVTRIHEEPRVTKPYSDDQWRQVLEVGRFVDQRLKEDDVRLTMGGEPTFISIDDMDGDEWNTTATGPNKRALAADLLQRLTQRFASGAMLHSGQGKWYPGESLPRWAMSCYWRTDGEPMWMGQDLITEEGKDYGHTNEDARRFVEQLAAQLEINPDFAVPAYEDVWHYAEKERKLPINVTPEDPRLEDAEERARLAEVFERGLNAVKGYVLPLRRQWWQAAARWESGPWPFRSQAMFLIPGDSPMGLRLPLDSLPWTPNRHLPAVTPQDPTAPRQSLPPARGRTAQPNIVPPVAVDSPSRSRQPISEQHLPQHGQPSESKTIRTALCIEPRNGQLHLFMPPLERLEDYLDLLQAVEQTTETLQTPVTIEGYVPPSDHRVNHIKVTPDPGVIEVNVHPSHDWEELVSTTTTLYEEARLARLGTEKFDLDGRHTGTGGGNHVVLGGPTPLESPFLRRPDLLRSLLGYWNNHPSLSYLFSGTFVGPTSQAPRIDEGRRDAIYELEIAFAQIPDAAGDDSNVPPWLVDRTFRNLLVDITGNTHRAEFCIDKLYSPDSATGRLGLVEFRAFEMPPHARMSITQQLLLRSLVSRFWRTPYQEKLVNWNTTLHDRFLLPHFVWEDFREVIDHTRWAGIELDSQWFAAHHEFRFPFIGSVECGGIEVELRQAIEPWYVLGEEPAGGGTVRYVDSSVERLQVRVRGMTDQRHVVTCNGRRVPLASTGVEGEFVAGVRYRAWQPPNCLHPTIPVHTPLVLDVVDSWNQRSIGGCTYHVAHPGGRNYTTYPVNAMEAEARRAARFFQTGHTGGRRTVPDLEFNPRYPLTLDLRRGAISA